MLPGRQGFGELLPFDHIWQPFQVQLRPIFSDPVPPTIPQAAWPQQSLSSILFILSWHQEESFRCFLNSSKGGLLLESHFLWPCPPPKPRATLGLMGDCHAGPGLQTSGWGLGLLLPPRVPQGKPWDLKMPDLPRSPDDYTGLGSCKLISASQDLPMWVYAMPSFLNYLLLVDFFLCLNSYSSWT